MKSAACFAIATLTLGLSSAAWSAPPQEGVRDEVRRELADARQEIRTELANARAELETENIDVGDSLQFGRDGRRKRDGDTKLPHAAITPRGDFLIDGRPVAIDAHQRQQLLAYRGLVLEIARAGIDMGEVAALAAVDAVDRGVFGLMVSAMTGSLERRIERTVRQTVEPGALQICARMPALHAAEQQLAADLPAFRPYAQREAREADACRDEVRRSFASR
ncbi:YggN family protein [Luteimonas sp. S4-F44]|uniref:YggN family protein n=1 Tax=Luteimonas sp. S4-F44 TaxID=2925842 RepID=UPI001F53B1FC|nr:YggN family protein [Luteimonas sp. S4-F44]UNK43795.1 YggN family protein [Luteimonas sp. S4-F44]